MRVAPLAALGILAAACARDSAPPADSTAPPQEVTITASDFAFQLPAAPIHSGLTTIRLVNQGQEIHHVTLIHLTGGKTMADFMAALANPGPPPEWMVAMGGPNGAPPGGEANATLILEPGSYVLACFIPSPDGVPHMAKGMSLGLEVQPADAPAAAVPAGDIGLTLMEYSFALSQTPTAGTHTFTVTNQGKEAHEVVLVQLAPGVTMDQAVAWFEGGEQGPPPVAPVGGLSGMNPGQVQNFTADLAPGTYGLICFVPGPDGAPHFAHGMAATFTIS